MADQVEEMREFMVEAAAEGSDELMEKYLEDGELSEDEIKQVFVLALWPMRLFRYWVDLPLRTRAYRPCWMLS